MLLAFNWPISRMVLVNWYIWVNIDHSSSCVPGPRIAQALDYVLTLNVDMYIEIN